ncbi:hypothetical protein JKF63_01617 [Porcisia hertigi]|uniref:Uncharacterized protein n=1 Tax=Porcisia hertigi TaxID=2761500 RepID=A0A836HZR2_9TRYP|nr:hypothetical protein JKF63_01617 [Porcisia hertigi]
MRSTMTLLLARMSLRPTLWPVVGACRMARRCCASTSPVAALSVEARGAPTLHQSVASAHMHTSCILSQLVSERTPSSLDAFVSVTEEWWGLVDRLVQLPAFAADVAQLLVETAHSEDVQRGHGGAEFEETILSQWEEWVWSSAPRTAPAPAARKTDAGEDVLPVSPTNIISFTQFSDLLHSYVRYHRGVRWGASRNSSDWASSGGAAAAAAYYRRRYFLHPWHGVHCPAGTTQQMPYVHILQWMLARKDGSEQASSSAAELWERYHALEPFQPSSSPFKALDVCCQSGYVLDLLIRAGAGVVVAADADPAALANTEATYHEYIRAGGGRHRNTLLYTRRCEGLPLPRERLTHSDKGRASSVLRRGDPGAHVGAEVQSTYASAAERRRWRAREEGRGYSGLTALSEEGALSGAKSSDTDGAAGSFDLLYIHPPTSESLWPVATTEHFDLRKTMWWRKLNHDAQDEGLDASVLLPYLPCSAAPTLARHSPLATRSGLERVLNELRADVMARGVTLSPSGDEARCDGALLTDEGYAVFVLPRTYDKNLLLRREMAGVPCLADWVVAQLSGYYDLILRRRYSAHTTPSSTKVAHSSNAVENMLLGVFRDAQRKVEGAASDVSAEWAAELQRISQVDMWHDVLVLRKNPKMVRQCAAQRINSLRQGTAAAAARERQRTATGAVQWEDSFEYNEYCPRGAAPHTSHHWTALVPTYSYLEKDFYDSPSATHNFLAVGHPVSANSAGSEDLGMAGGSMPSATTAGQPIQEADGVTAASQLASVNHKTVFAEELRTRRRSKLRKLALSPLERQEWYIDEKLIKSNAARLELLNEISKWDLKDYD